MSRRKVKKKKIKNKQNALHPRCIANTGEGKLFPCERPPKGYPAQRSPLCGGGGADQKRGGGASERAWSNNKKETASSTVSKTQKKRIKKKKEKRPQCYPSQISTENQTTCFDQYSKRGVSQKKFKRKKKISSPLPARERYRNIRDRRIHVSPSATCGDCLDGGGTNNMPLRGGEQTYVGRHNATGVTCRTSLLTDKMPEALRT